MWLGYTPQINFLSLFVQFELFDFQKLSHLESDVPVGGIVFHKHIFSFYIDPEVLWKPF